MTAADRGSARRAARAPAVALAALVLAVSVLAAGCTDLPSEGPVRDADIAASVDQGRASDLTPAKPREGASRTEIVRGFIDAMTASPIRLETAREYLTNAAAQQWDPQAATITYTGNITPTDEGSRVTVSLDDAERLDRTGGWKGRLPPDQQVLSFTVTLEDGEFRIVDPPDALVVPASWFSQRFQQASLYFFDIAGQILVPEPVFVPSGDQLASALLTGLLSGPPGSLRRVVTSFLPSGLGGGLSVPVSDEGVATVTLGGDARTRSPAADERMLAQLAWTLRQVPGVEGVRLTIGDSPVTAPDGGSVYPVDKAVTFDAEGIRASERLYGLSEGKVVAFDGSTVEPVAGSFGTGRLDVRSVSVDLSATQAAAISADGTTLMVGAVGAASSPPDPVVRPITDGTDLMTPHWDYKDRIWAVDRTGSGAVVHTVTGREQHVVRVPGVTGRQVRSFVVSRDGTRLVAVVRGRQRDLVRVCQVELDDEGEVARVRSNPPVADESGPARIRALAWTSPTTLALLSPSGSDSILQLRTVRVDGYPVGTETVSRLLADPLLGLAGAPSEALPVYELYGTGVVDLDTGVFTTFGGPRVTSLGYVG